MEISLQMDSHDQPLNQLIDFLIVGGGIASLSAANRLVDLKKRPLLVEGKSFPSHKVCGEFLSPEIVDYLKEWDIVPQSKIKKVKIFSENTPFTFTFPNEAAGISRYELDLKLAERAKKRGACILENCQLVEIKKNDSDSNYLATLSTGETFFVKNVLIGSGRFFEREKNSKKKLYYFGFKAHFKEIKLDEELEMYFFKNGYLGISHVEKEVVNVACLIKIKDKQVDILQKGLLNPLDFIDQFLKSEEAKKIKKRLDSGEMIFKEWLYTLAPEFGIKKKGDLKNVYFIGDAAGSIPPVTGNGLSIGLTSGKMAADYAIKGDYRGYKKAFTKRYGARIKWGKLLHQIVTQPWLLKMGLFLVKKIKLLPRIIFSFTRERQVDKKSNPELGHPERLLPSRHMKTIQHSDPN